MRDEDGEILARYRKPAFRWEKWGFGEKEEGL